MGRNLGGRMGMIVCMDVPRLAYRNAGASLRRLLEEDYRAHPEHYGKKDGRPGDPFFERRARNLYSYCKFNGCLDLKGPPLPGDVVFMSHGENGWISHIALVSETTADDYHVIEATREEDARVRILFYPDGGEPKDVGGLGVVDVVAGFTPFTSDPATLYRFEAFAKTRLVISER